MAIQYNSRFKYLFCDARVFNTRLTVSYIKCHCKRHLYLYRYSNPHCHDGSFYAVAPACFSEVTTRRRVSPWNIPWHARKPVYYGCIFFYICKSIRTLRPFHRCRAYAIFKEHALQFAHNWMYYKRWNLTFVDFFVDVDGKTEFARRPSCYLDVIFRAHRVTCKYQLVLNGVSAVPVYIVYHT